MDHIKGQFSPIILVGMSRHSLLHEVDNNQIEEDVLKERSTKVNFNSKEASVEDYFLPRTPAVNCLLEKVDAVVKSVNTYLIMGDEAWTHLIDPGQSTMFHTHQDPGPPGLSFVYWVNFPKNSGDFVGIIQVDKYRHFHKVRPNVGDLILFPTYLPHITSRNCSDKTRISISGNYYPPLDRLDAVQKEPGSLLNYVGRINGR